MPITAERDTDVTADPEHSDWADTITVQTLLENTAHEHIPVSSQFLLVTYNSLKSFMAKMSFDGDIKWDRNKQGPHL